MPTADPSRATAETPPRRRRIALWLALGLVLLGAFLVAGAMPAVLGARADIERGEAAVREAARHVERGDMASATGSFEEAADAFGAARWRMDRLPVRIGGWIPLIGNNVDVVRDLAAAGRLAAAAGGELTQGVAELPDGIGSLAPKGGGFPTDAFADLEEPVATAATRAEQALSLLEASPGSFLFGPVGEARWDALVELEGAARGLRASEALVASMPSFLGEDEPRRYLVAPENPAEQRGTGGFWGAYAILTLRDGAPSFSEVQAIQDLPVVEAAEVPAPSPDYAENYAQFGGAGSWHNLNMTPDLPTAARASLGAWELATGRSYDGLIVADPFALEALMRVTGPVAVPTSDIEIRPSEVVDVTTNEAYSIFDDTRLRKDALGAVAIAVLERFLAGDDRDGEEKARTIAKAVTEGHLRIYSTDPTFQDALALAGIDGSLTPPEEADAMFVDVNNAGANKIDYYAERSVTHEVALGGEGAAVARTEVVIANEAPTSGQPRIVIGPAPPLAEIQEAGDQHSITRLWCREPCEFVDGGVDGEPAEFGVGTEAGMRWFRDVGIIPSGARRTITLATKSGDSWEGNGSGGVYRLSVENQTTIRPTSWSLRIEAPEGTRIVWTNVPMEVDGAVATWEGSIDAGLDLEVRFGAPAPVRWWRNLLRPFGGL